jgi:hypothetical protein
LLTADDKGILVHASSNVPEQVELIKRQQWDVIGSPKRRIRMLERQGGLQETAVRKSSFTLGWYATALVASETRFLPIGTSGRIGKSGTAAPGLLTS